MCKDKKYLFTTLSYIQLPYGKVIKKDKALKLTKFEIFSEIMFPFCFHR